MIEVGNKTFEPKYFGDGTLKMLNMDEYNIPENRTVRIVWRFDGIHEYVIVMYLVNYIKDVKRSEVELDLRYVPDARMDRVKNPAKEGHTLKYFMNFINWLEFTKVTVTDPHSPVTMTLLNRGVERDISQYIQEVNRTVHIDRYIFPDKGAHQRYSYLNDKPSDYCEKQRSWDTGRLDDNDPNALVLQVFDRGDKPLQGESICIIDDIIAYGGTGDRAVNACHKAGAERIFMFVTHCENDILKGRLINNPHLERIFTTSSIFRGKHERIWYV